MSLVTGQPRMELCVAAYRTKIFETANHENCNFIYKFYFYTVEHTTHDRYKRQNSH
jgi:hypothetical protein